MAQPRHRKLTAMALASLASTGRLEVLQKIADIFVIWTDVFTEIKERQQEECVSEADSGCAILSACLIFQRDMTKAI